MAIQSRKKVWCKDMAITANKQRVWYKARTYAAILVWLHAVVTVVHGIAHFGANIGLSLFGNLFVAVVIVIAPFAALLLLYTRLNMLGIWLLLLSMLGAFVFGIVEHFILPGTDNVAQVAVGMWNLPFQITSYLLAIIEFVGIGISGWLLYIKARTI
jgi:hypothetical protein